MFITMPEPRPIKWLAFVLNTISGCILVLMTAVTCVDIIGRYVFNNPLTGSNELIELGLSILVFAVLPVISWRHENIVVDIFDKYFSSHIHIIKNIIIDLISVVALYYIGERLFALGFRSLSYGEFSDFLKIPTGWGINFMAIMCWFTAIVVFTLSLFHIYAACRQRLQE